MYIQLHVDDDEVVSYCCRGKSCIGLYSSMRNKSPTKIPINIGTKRSCWFYKSYSFLGLHFEIVFNEAKYTVLSVE